jgi:hypothetical protein
MEADYGNDRQSTPPVQGGDVIGKAGAFRHLLLLSYSRTHTFHPLWRAKNSSLEVNAQNSGARAKAESFNDSGNMVGEIA